MAGHEIIADPTRDEDDFKGKETEFEALSKELLHKELELATLQNELGIFETRYAKIIGVLFAELDEIEKEIAKELFRLHPEEKYKRGFENAQKKARNSQQAVNEKIGQSGKGIPSKELKKLYFKVVKTIHPDLNTNDDETEYRTILTARANDAFANGDKEALEQILVEWEHRRHKKSVSDVLLPVKVNQLEKKISQIKVRLKEIEVRIGELKKSDIYQLMLKVKRAEEQGLDLLSDMKNELQRQIKEANSLLNNLKQQRKAE
jgi:hypothetical protein